MKAKFTRRHILGTGALLGGGLFAPNILRAENRGNNKLNIAAVGVGGMGTNDVRGAARGNNILALCDVDLRMDRERGAGPVIGDFPDAETFTDYREMFAKLADKIDAVTISTPDHMHFPIAIEALRHGKHVYVQKPLANRIAEARIMQQVAATKDVMTVMGNQGHTMTGIRRIREWLDAGLLGQITEVHGWTNRPIWPQGPGVKMSEEDVPEGVDWDIWQGTVATERPYSPDIHPFKWRGFWDYGCGALGDMACHQMDAPFLTLDLSGDFEVEAVETTEFDENIAPKKTTVVYRFPAKGGRGPVKMTWKDGVEDPNAEGVIARPEVLPDDLKFGTGGGMIFVGEKGVIYINDAYAASPQLFPEALAEAGAKVEPTYARVQGGPTGEWVAAIKGEGPKPGSNFDYAAPLTEMVLAGIVALQVGEKIDWDAENMKARGLEAADAFIHREYREGWKPDLDGLLT